MRGTMISEAPSENLNNQDDNKDDSPVHLRGGGGDEEEVRGADCTRSNDAEAQDKNHASPQTLRGSGVGEGKLGEGSYKEEDNLRVKRAKKYKLSAEEEMTLAQAKEEHRAPGLNSINWCDPLVRKKHNYECCLGLHNHKGTVNVRKYIEFLDRTAASMEQTKKARSQGALRFRRTP